MFMAMVKDYLKNNFKHGIEAGILQYGVVQETTSPDVAEVLATSNYDWLFVDGEHGPHTVQTILAICRAVAPFNITPVVRVPEAGTGIFKQLLDAGVQNIIIPKVETGEETENIMYWASYAPRGKRGLENLEDIVKVPGVGGIFLGSIDLAVDMGHGIDIFHPEVADAMDYMIKRIKELGKPVGTIAVTPEQAKHFADLGVSFLALGADTAFLAAGADNTLDTFKKAIQSK